MDTRKSIWICFLDFFGKIKNEEDVYLPQNIWGSSNPLFSFGDDLTNKEYTGFLSDFLKKNGLINLYELNIRLSDLLYKITENIVLHPEEGLDNIKVDIDGIISKYPELEKYIEAATLYKNINTAKSKYPGAFPISAQMESIELMQFHTQYIIERWNLEINIIEKSESFFRGFLNSGHTNEEVLTYLLAIHKEKYPKSIENILSEWKNKYDIENRFAKLKDRRRYTEFIQVLRLCQTAQINDYNIYFKEIANSIDLIPPEVILKEYRYSFRKRLWEHFYLFYSDTALELFRYPLKNLLFNYHNLLNKILTKKSIYPYQDYDLYELICILTSTYIFGCYRVIDLERDDNLIESALSYLFLRERAWMTEIDYKNHFVPESITVSLGARLIHACSFLSQESINTYLSPLCDWLWSHQTDYGQWKDAEVSDPCVITVLVLEALNVMRDQSTIRKLTYSHDLLAAIPSEINWGEIIDGLPIWASAKELAEAFDLPINRVRTELIKKYKKTGRFDREDFRKEIPEAGGKETQYLYSKEIVTSILVQMKQNQLKKSQKKQHKRNT